MWHYSHSSSLDGSGNSQSRAELTTALRTVEGFADRWDTVTTPMPATDIPPEWTSTRTQYLKYSTSTRTRSSTLRMAQIIIASNFPWIDPDLACSGTYAVTSKALAPDKPLAARQPFSAAVVAATAADINAWMDAQSGAHSSSGASGLPRAPKPRPPPPLLRLLPDPTPPPPLPQAAIQGVYLDGPPAPPPPDQGSPPFPAQGTPSSPPSPKSPRALVSPGSPSRLLPLSNPLRRSPPYAPPSKERRASSGSLQASQQVEAAPTARQRRSSLPLLGYTGRLGLNPLRTPVSPLQAAAPLGLSRGSSAHPAINSAEGLSAADASPTAATAAIDSPARSRNPSPTPSYRSARSLSPRRSRSSSPAATGLQAVLAAHHLPLVQLPFEPRSTALMVCTNTETLSWRSPEVKLLGKDAKEVAEFFEASMYYYNVNPEALPTSASSYYAVLSYKMAAQALKDILSANRDAILAAASAPLPAAAAAEGQPAPAPILPDIMQQMEIIHSKLSALLNAYVVPNSGASVASFNRFAEEHAETYKEPAALLAELMRQQKIIGNNKEGKPLISDNKLLSTAVTMLNNMSPLMLTIPHNSRLEPLGTYIIDKMCAAQAPPVRWIEVRKEGTVPSPGDFGKAAADEFHFREGLRTNDPPEARYSKAPFWLAGTIPASRPAAPPPSTNSAQDGSHASTPGSKGPRRNRGAGRNVAAAAASNAASPSDITAAAIAAATAAAAAATSISSSSTPRPRPPPSTPVQCKHGCAQPHAGGEENCPIHNPWRFRQYALPPDAPSRMFNYLKGRCFIGMADNHWSQEDQRAYWEHRWATFPQTRPASMSGVGSGGGRSGGRGPHSGGRSGGSWGRGNGHQQPAYGPVASMQQADYDTLSYGDYAASAVYSQAPSTFTSRQPDAWDALAAQLRSNAQVRDSVRSAMAESEPSSPFASGMLLGRGSINALLDFDSTSYEWDAAAAFDLAAGLWGPTAGGVTSLDSGTPSHLQPFFSVTTMLETDLSALMHPELSDIQSTIHGLSAALQSFQSEPTAELTAEANLNKAPRASVIPADPVVRASVSVTPAQARVEVTALQLQVATIQQRLRINLPSLNTLPSEVSKMQQQLNDLGRRIDRYLQDHPDAGTIPASSPSLPAASSGTIPELSSALHVSTNGHAGIIPAQAAANSLVTSLSPNGHAGCIPAQAATNSIIASTLTTPITSASTVTPGYQQLLRLHEQQQARRGPIRKEYSGVRHTVGFFAVGNERQGITLCGPNGKRIMVPKNLVDSGSILCSVDEELAEEAGLILERAHRTVVACNGDVIVMRWFCPKCLFYIILPNGQAHFFTVPVWVMKRNKHFRMIWGIPGLANFDITFVIDIARRCLVVRPNLFSGCKDSFEIPLDCVELAPAAAGLVPEESHPLHLSTVCPMLGDLFDTGAAISCVDETTVLAAALPTQVWLHVIPKEISTLDPAVVHRAFLRLVPTLFHRYPATEILHSNTELYARLEVAAEDSSWVTAWEAGQEFINTLSENYDCRFCGQPDQPELFEMWQLGSPLPDDPMVTMGGDNPIYGRFDADYNPAGMQPEVQASFYLSPARIITPMAFGRPGDYLHMEMGTTEEHPRRMVSFRQGFRMDFHNNSDAQLAFDTLSAHPFWRTEWIRQPVTPSVPVPLQMTVGMPPYLSDRIPFDLTRQWHTYSSVLLQVEPLSDPPAFSSLAQTCLGYAAVRYYGAHRVFMSPNHAQYQPRDSRVREGQRQQCPGGPLYIEWEGVISDRPLHGPVAFSEAYKHLARSTQLAQAPAHLMERPPPDSRHDEQVTYSFDTRQTPAVEAVVPPPFWWDASVPIIPAGSSFWPQHPLHTDCWGVWAQDVQPSYSSRDFNFVHTASLVLLNPEVLGYSPAPYRAYLLEYGILFVFAQPARLSPDTGGVFRASHMHGFRSSPPFKLSSLVPTPGVPRIPAARLLHLDAADAAQHLQRRTILNTTTHLRTTLLPDALMPAWDPLYGPRAAATDNGDAYPIHTEVAPRGTPPGPE